MTFDPSLYERLVWKPLVSGSASLTDNLWVVFGFPDPFDSNLEVHYKGVKGFWLKNNKGSQKDLVAKVQGLYKDKTPGSEELQQQRDAALGQAAGRIKDLASNRSALAPSELESLVGALPVPVPEPLLEPILKKHAVQIVDPGDITGEPDGFKRFYRGLTLSHPTSLTHLYCADGDGSGAASLRFSVVTTLGVMNGSGRGLAQQLDQVEAENKLMGSQLSAVDKKTFTQIKKAVTDNKYHDFLLYELVEFARRLEGQSLSQKQVAAELGTLGLADTDALLISVAVVGETGGVSADPMDRIADDLVELLNEGRLLEAQRRLSPDMAESGNEALKAVVAQINSRLKAYGEAKQKAEAAASAGRHEDAAIAWQQAAEFAKDDPEPGKRFAAVAPPVPASGSCNLRSDGTVLLQWEASRAQFGNVAYEVRRHTQPPVSVSDGERLSIVERREHIDESPPAARDLYYAVFAKRGGSPASMPLAMGPVFVTPEIGGLSKKADASSVTAHWKVPELAIDVRVTRRTDRPPARPGDGEEIATDGPHGFVDRSVEAGTTYHYLVSVRYRGRGGGLVDTDGLAFSARPQVPSEPVGELCVGALTNNDESLQLTWSGGQGGTDIRILRSRTAPRLAFGQEVSIEEIEPLGDLFAGSTDGSGRGRIEVPVLAGTSHLTVVTFGYDGVIIGRSIRYTQMVPVQELEAERMQDHCLLRWRWPESSTAALVTHWASDGNPDEAEQVEISRRRYLDEGVRIQVGSGPVTIRVQIVGSGPARGELSSAKEVKVPGIAVAMVTYGLKRRRFRKEATLYFDTQQEIELEGVDVVWSRNRLIPTSAREGRVLTKIDRLRVSPSGTAEVEVDLGQIPKDAVWLACFSSSNDIALAPASREQMRLKS